MIIWFSNLKLRLNNIRNVYLTGQIKVKWKEIISLLAAAPLGVTTAYISTLCHTNLLHYIQQPLLLFLPLSLLPGSSIFNIQTISASPLCNFVPKPLNPSCEDLKMFSSSSASCSIVFIVQQSPLT